MSARPKIDIGRSDGDNLMESFGWLALLVLWGIALYGYVMLPAVIPTHFNSAGRIDAHGPKAMIFLLPLVGTVVFATMTVVNRFPHRFNYPVRITAENARVQYTMATRLMRYLKTAIVALFAILTYDIHQAATGSASGLPGWFPPFTLGLLLISTVYYVYRSFQAK
jgi:uncharacterized membrane protein